MKSTTIAMTLLGAFLAAPAISQPQQHDIEHLVVEMANTPEEHKGVAEHYRLKAQEARDEAQRHQQMGQVYAARRSSTPQQGRQHCEAIAKDFQAIATEYDALAKLHDELSKNPAQ